MKNDQETLRRAAPFVMAMLLATLIPLNAYALFGSKKAEQAPAPGAPVAQNMEIKAYRGVPYSGTLAAVDGEGEAVTFAIVDAPQKGALELGENGAFVYTAQQNKAGTDRFTFTATDASGNVSQTAAVKIRIERVSSGVNYADTHDAACATAAVDLAEHGVFVGARVGGDWFFEPERTVSRSEFVAMAMAAAGLDGSDVTMTGFCDDAAIPTWAKGAIAGALSAGVVQGEPTADGAAFHPDSAVTLSEAAAMLNRILRVTDVDLADFADSAPAWCAQAVANLESVSIAPVGGYNAEALSRPVTRAEAAQLLSAAMALAHSRAESGSFWDGLT